MDSEKTAITAQIDRIEDQIISETERLDKRYETMTLQFVALDSYMRQMESMSGYIAMMTDMGTKDDN